MVNVNNINNFNNVNNIVKWEILTHAMVFLVDLILCTVRAMSPSVANLRTFVVKSTGLAKWGGGDSVIYMIYNHISYGKQWRRV